MNRVATVSRNAMNTYSSVRRESLWATFTPSGAVSTLKGATTIAPAMLTKPSDKRHACGHVPALHDVAGYGGDGDDGAEARRRSDRLVDRPAEEPHIGRDIDPAADADKSREQPYARPREPVQGWPGSFSAAMAPPLPKAMRQAMNSVEATNTPLRKLDGACEAINTPRTAPGQPKARGGGSPGNPSRRAANASARSGSRLG